MREGKPPGGVRAEHSGRARGATPGDGRSVGVRLRRGGHRLAALAGAGRAGFILEGPAEWTVRPVGEVFVEAEHAVPGVTSSLLGGVIWRISPRVSSDAALRVGTVSGTGLVELRVGLTWDVPL